MAFLSQLMLLSICYVSAALPQAEIEIISTKAAGDKPPSVLNLNPDINSVLTDISVQLARQEVEVKFLQRENEELKTKLKELELQKCELEKLQEQDKQQQQLLQQQQQQLQEQQQQDKQQQQQQQLLQEQQQQLQEQQQQDKQQQQQQLQEQQQQIQQQSTKLKELELQKSELEKLQEKHKQLLLLLQQQQQQIQTQAAELVTIKTKANITETQVEALRKDREVRQVAFSTSLMESGDGHTGPISTETTLIFRRVIENIGKAYNPVTGRFTASVRGAYHFELHIFGYGSNSYRVGADLMKNEQKICRAYERQTSGYVSASNGATLLLEVGDVVFLRLRASDRIYDHTNHYNTFSGHLLFTM